MVRSAEGRPATRPAKILRPCRCTDVCSMHSACDRYIHIVTTRGERRRCPSMPLTSLRLLREPQGYFMLSLRRSRCSSNRRRFASSSQRILCASHVLTPAALERIMRPFCRCTRWRASATCPSARRRSSSKPIWNQCAAPSNARTEPEPVRDPAQALPSWLPGTGGVAPEVVRTRSGELAATLDSINAT